ncbi:MAG: FKBP-type peptidyl-prolyl cis-trans isomerase [Flavobacteriales bacterium]
MLAVPFLFAACSNSPHAGFKEVSDGVHLRYHSLGDGEELVQDDDSIHLLVRMTQLGGEAGSLLSTQRWYAAADLRHGAFVPLLQRMHEGDSISLIARASELPWDALSPRGWRPPSGASDVQLEFALLNIRTPDMIQAENERHRLADPEGYQRKLIAAFVERSGHEWEVWGTSLLHHRISGIASDTARVEQGDMVHVSWYGSRLEDGAPMDDTKRTGGPFIFRYGDQDQVIKGIETAVLLLREGQEGEFILPAEMAFGARGVEGLVDPGSPVRYVVTLERVERRGAISPAAQR